MLIFEESEPALWLGTAGAGLFMSSVFPTSIALAEYYIDLTGQKMTTSIHYYVLTEHSHEQGEKNCSYLITVTIVTGSSASFVFTSLDV